MFEDIKNNIDFFIRNKTKFSRKNFIEKNQKLIERNKKENNYTKDILKKYFSKNTKENIKILDIGCKNWFYAQGEWEFFNSFCKNFSLYGVEIDAHRLYSNLYSRYEVAKYYTKNLKNTTYIPDDLLNLKDNYDYIIWLLPFVSLTPHRYWGLPKKLFKPKELLKHAYSILNKKGQMLIINQGKNEMQLQKQLLKELQIPYTNLGLIENDYFKYQNERYGFLIKN